MVPGFRLEGRNVAAAVAADLGPGMHPRVSIRGGAFHLIDAGGSRYAAPIILMNTPNGQVTTMRVIIIDSVNFE